MSKSFKEEKEENIFKISDDKKQNITDTFFSLFNVLKKKKEIQNPKQNLKDMFEKPSSFKLEKEEVDNWKLEDFEKLEVLGVGAFGKVYKCKNTLNDQFYAMKVLKKRVVIYLKQVEHTLNEKTLQMELECPFIVKLFKTFQDSNYLYMIMEYIQAGELRSWLRKNEKFNTETCKFLCAEILIALEFIHSQNCVYRDLKPENILIDKYGHVKLADFGFVKKVKQKTWSTVGSLNYLPPEILLSVGHDKSADYWSLGVLLFEMTTGYLPFDGDTQIEVYKNINEGKIKIPKFVPKVTKDLILKLLKKEKNERIGSLEGGVNDIKTHPFFEGIDWNEVALRRIQSPLITNIDNEGTSKYFNVVSTDSRKVSIESLLKEDENDLFKDF